MNPPSATAPTLVASGKTVPAATSPFDPTRFNHLGEAELLRRIGELLATALGRSGRLLRRRGAPAVGSVTAAAAPMDPLDLIGDPIERQIARFLQHAGPAALRDLGAALGLNRRTTARKLAHLNE